MVSFDWARGSLIGCYSDMCGSSCVIGAHDATKNVMNALGLSFLPRVEMTTGGERAKEKESGIKRDMRYEL